MPFVKDLCSQNECDWLVDVGSGVGHFDKYLVANSNVSVIGIERKSDFVAGANKRQSNGQFINFRDFYMRKSGYGELKLNLMYGIFRKILFFCRKINLKVNLFLNLKKF